MRSLTLRRRLTMRLSDEGLRQRQTKLIYLDHRSTPGLTEDATRDRSNRLLDVSHRIKNEYILELLQRRADLRLIETQRKVEFVTNTGLILRDTA